MVKQLAHKSHLDARFWALSWLNAVELRNLFPHARLHGNLQLRYGLIARTI
jgi:hypothetical protein